MNFDEARQYLLNLGHETVAMKFGLENTKRLLAALNQPQQAYPKVQIAGTNGKGSTAVMLEAIARAADVRTGLYISPHLISITERIRINGLEISQDEFARLTTYVRLAAERLLADGTLAALPTFFEHVTVIALVAFKEAGVELAILETGLGGRLDATTAARAETVALTPIALDHQEYLGNSLAEIAAEKAAIIRPGVAAVIVAPQSAEALAVIQQRCDACNLSPRDGARVSQVIEADSEGHLRLTFETERDTYNARLGLAGRHQAFNAGVAVGLAEALCEQGFAIARTHIVEGIANARHAGRLEWRDDTPKILFDGAHNAAGAFALREFLQEFVHAPLTFVFGAMRDKDLSEIASQLFPLAQCLILTQPDNPRAATPEMLRRLSPSNPNSIKVMHAPNVPEALQAARAETPVDGIICITGSLYLVGEAQKILRDEAARALP
jgi:dihydrofolate synthase/folylpolyglutamate synthase